MRISVRYEMSAISFFETGINCQLYITLSIISTHYDNKYYDGLLSVSAKKEKKLVVP